MTSKLKELCDTVCKISAKAGEILLREYTNNGDPENAAIASNNLITTLLSDLHLPAFIITPITDPAPFNLREKSMVWLVHPLDGIEAFSTNNNEFTINIALIVKGDPALGVIHQPTTNLTWWAYTNGGGWRTDSTKTTTRLYSNSIDITQPGLRIVIQPDIPLPSGYVYPQITKVWSSLKFVMVAEGIEDVCPQNNDDEPEWSVAAGHIIIKESGRKTSECIKYNTRELLVQKFIIL